MRELRKKLHSQSGASILLALLFLLACMMVGGSVLAAAVSNAGKLRSNYEEQQRYLALSSALRLVAGELEQARYYGWYTVNEWTETVTIVNPDGSVTTDTTPYYNIQQAMGAFDCGPLSELDSEGKTPNNLGVPLDQEVLTFRKELDGLFAKEFTGTGYTGLSETMTASLPTNPPGAPDEDKTTRELTLTVQGTEELGKKFGTAKVTVDMSQGRRLHLRAWLDDEPAYVMEAELAAAGNMPTIKYPADREPKDGPGVNSNAVVSRTEKTEAVTWKLDWISREVKEEKKGAGG